MKPSSKLGSLCGLIFCCVAPTLGAAHAATRAVPHVMTVAHPMFDVRGPRPHPINGAVRNPLQRNVVARPQMNLAARHFHRHRFFGTGFIGPYLSGSYLTAPVIADVAGPEAAVYGDDDAADYRPPCVVPLVIDLRTKHHPRKLPTVTYGQPGYCPPSVTIAAPLKHARDRSHLD